MSLRIGEVPQTTDVLVIGSGFGGSVVAETLAEAGVEVCLVERGKGYPPGSFPRTPAGVGTNFWDPSAGLHGMFNVWSFDGLDSVVSSGVGGGSLIYANVMLRKDESWFRQHHPYRPGITEEWSFGYGDLEPHYDAVERFLDVQRLPAHHPQFNLPKTAAFQAAATRLDGAHTTFAPLAVRFRDAQGEPAIGAPLPDAGYPNLFGAPRRTCRMLGECDVGCNDGAKNSLDHTYLSAASHHGASLHERTEVRTITRRDDGRFDVEVVVHRPENEGSPTDTRALPIHTITARRVVVSAGTFGSTYLLLKNRERLGLDNPALGTRFCGNGDLLGFIFNSREKLDGTNGPVITSYARFPDRIDTGAAEDFGMYIEDAGYPAFAAWLVETSQAGRQLGRLSGLVAKRMWSRWTGRRRTSLSADIASVLGPGRLTAQSLPVLGMGRDIPDGTLYLRNGDTPEEILDSTWTTRTSMNYFDTMVHRMGKIAELLDGDFVVNPSYLLQRRVITVHPLGGCPADTTRATGVVDSHGRVHGVPGLRVCDGSVFPGPVGANPSLTIAAFARRVALDMLEESPSTYHDDEDSELAGAS